MKSNKAIKNLAVLVVVFLVLILSCISFIGIYKRDLNKWENIIPKFSFSSEFNGEGVRVFSFNVDKSTKEDTEKNNEEEKKLDDSVDVNENVSTEGTENNEEANTDAAESETTENETEEKTKTVPVNDESVLNKENYIKVKNMIQNRFEKFGIDDYVIRVNEDNGKIEIEVPYQKNTDSAIDLVTNSGKVEIIDSDSEELLLDNSDIQSVSAYYVPSENTNDAIDLGIQINFNNNGLKKFKDITKQYVETVGDDGESKIKSITIRVNDEDKYKTYFTADGNYTYLSFPLYQGLTEDDDVDGNYNKCTIIQDCINSGNLPVVYKLDSGIYLETNNNVNITKIFAVLVIAIVAIISIIFILKNKKTGLYALLLEIGFVAGLLLLIRLSSVTISITGLGGILASVLLNYYFMAIMLKDQEKSYLTTIKKFIFNTLPIWIIMIVFSFSNILQLKSFGMVLFWGLLITVIYNLIFTKLLFTSSEETEKGAEK